MKSTIKWLIETLPAEVVEQNKILLNGAIDVEKAALHHCWSIAQLEQLKADYGKNYEKFDDYYKTLNND